MSEFDVGPGLAILAATYLPLTALLVTFTVDLTFTGLTRNRAMHFLVVGVIANFTAALLAGLRLVERVPTDSQPMSLGLFVAAFMLLCAGLTDPAIGGAVDPQAQTVDIKPDTRPRLLLMGLSVLPPLALIAAVAPTSDTDTAVRITGTALLIAAVVLRLSLAIRDNAEAHEALLQQVDRDELTKLPTRSRFMREVAEVLEETWRTEHHPTIIQLNLDRFKNINDSLGHSGANRVLVVVAERLTGAARGFAGFVARSGGDDFVIVDRSTATEADSLDRVESIRSTLARPITVEDSTVFVTASIGAAMAPRKSTITAEELMRRADIAAHRAKADGRDRVAMFDDSMQAHLTRRMDVEQALHGAIGRREMRLYHQPIVDIVTGKLSGFEALMRWQRTEGSLVPPNDFIPIAEETGIICELGAWALDDALRELKGWIDSGMAPATTTMSVNVSPRQIADPNFAQIVRDTLDRTGAPPRMLWLEMTESMMLEEPEMAQSTLRQIRAMGVRLALDDFGTGYSSLSLLQQFPIQRIKIDRSFVQGIAERENDRSLVRTVIAMAQSMGLDLVAEGVETVDQLQILRELGCDKAQGYLISRPVPPDAMRSTMSALDELADLSLFGPSGVEATPRSYSDRYSDRDREPVRQHASAGPMVGLASRPLGQPSI
jgi:diguanylate cyclase (GGDEF)-like protein